MTLHTMCGAIPMKKKGTNRNTLVCASAKMNTCAPYVSGAMQRRRFKRAERQRSHLIAFSSAMYCAGMYASIHNRRAACRSPNTTEYTKSEDSTTSALCNAIANGTPHAYPL